MFLRDDIDVAKLERPLTLDSFKPLPPEQQPMCVSTRCAGSILRAHQITVDFVVHGEHGVAGPWASTAKPGDTAHLMGLSGAYSPDPLFARDEAGIPAIDATLEALPPNAVDKVFIEIAGPEDEIDLAAPARIARRSSPGPKEARTRECLINAAARG